MDRIHQEKWMERYRILSGSLDGALGLGGCVSAGLGQIRTSVCNLLGRELGG